MFLAQDWLQAQRDALNAQLAARQVEEGPEIEVLVAAENLPRGTFIKENQLRWQAWPEDGLNEFYIVRENGRTEAEAPLEDLMGAVVRNGLTVGEPITDGRLVRPGDRGFLAAVLRPGLRAISVPVSATAGVAGFVFPGDRVDLMLTHEIARDGGTRRASETILRDVRVLAVDQSVDDQNGAPRVAKTATLELTPKQAEMITVSLQIGSLSMALRSLGVEEDERKVVEKRSHTWDSQASRLLGGAAGPQGPKVTVYRRNEAQTMIFSKAAQ